MENRPYTFDRVTRLIISVVIVAVVIYFILLVKEALIPFLLAWFFAYLINPIVLFVQRVLHIKLKIFAVIIVLLLFLAAIGGFAWAFVPKIVEEVQRGIVLINNSQFPLQVKHYLQEINISNDWLEKGFGMVWTVITESFNLIFAIIAFSLTFIYLVFILKDYEHISSGAIALIPDRFREKALVVIDDVESGMNRYFRGQALVALCVGVLLAIGFKIISLPMGIVLGLFFGVLNLVPYLQVVGIIPMVMLSLLQSGNTGESFWVVFGVAFGVLAVVQIIQDMFLVPKIMGKVTGLNPAIILLSLSIWGLLLGIVGMIIALPLTTILLSYYKRFLVKDIREMH